MKADVKTGILNSVVMSSLDLDNLFDENERYTKRYVLKKIQEKEFESFKRNWSHEINN